MNKSLQDGWDFLGKAIDTYGSAGRDPVSGHLQKRASTKPVSFEKTSSSFLDAAKRGRMLVHGYGEKRAVAGDCKRSHANLDGYSYRQLNDGLGLFKVAANPGSIGRTIKSTWDDAAKGIGNFFSKKVPPPQRAGMGVPWSATDDVGEQVVKQTPAAVRGAAGSGLTQTAMTAEEASKALIQQQKAMAALQKQLDAATHAEGSFSQNVDPSLIKKRMPVGEVEKHNPALAALRRDNIQPDQVMRAGRQLTAENLANAAKAEQQNVNWWRRNAPVWLGGRRTITPDSIKPTPEDALAQIYKNDAEYISGGYTSLDDMLTASAKPEIPDAALDIAKQRSAAYRAANPVASAIGRGAATIATPVGSYAVGRGIEHGYSSYMSPETMPIPADADTIPKDTAEFNRMRNTKNTAFNAHADIQAQLGLGNLAELVMSNTRTFLMDPARQAIADQYKQRVHQNIINARQAHKKAQPEWYRGDPAAQEWQLERQKELLTDPEFIKFLGKYPKTTGITNQAAVPLTLRIADFQKKLSRGETPTPLSTDDWEAYKYHILPAMWQYDMQPHTKEAFQKLYDETKRLHEQANRSTAAAAAPAAPVGASQ